MLLAPLPILRVLRRDRSGSSSPVVAATSDGPWFVKLRGAAQGPAALVAEVIVGGLADRLELPVPDRRVLRLPSDPHSDDRNDELADLLARSVGDNLGFRWIEGAHVARPTECAEAPLDFAARVRWLDWLAQNPDRSPANPNLLRQGQRWWLIDHGAALPFQHDWSAVTEQSPTRAGRRLPHLFDTLAAGQLAAWDPLLTALLSRQTLTEVVASVPDSFLAPLLPAPGPPALARRRAGYVAYLWKRLQGPREELLRPPG